MITEIEGVVEDIKLAKIANKKLLLKLMKQDLTSGTSVEVGQSVERGEV